MASASGKPLWAAAPATPAVAQPASVAEGASSASADGATTAAVVVDDAAAAPPSASGAPDSVGSVTPGAGVVTPGAGVVTPNPGSGVATPLVGPGTALQSIPPCPLFEDLRTFETLDHMSQEFSGLQTKDAIELAAQKLAVFKVACKQMLSSLRAGVRELNAAVKAAQKQKEMSDMNSAAEASPAGAKQKPQKGKGAPSSALEPIQAKGDEIPCFPASGFPPADGPQWLREEIEIDGATPYVLTNLDWAKTWDPKAHGLVGTSAESFAGDWKKSPLRDSSGRAMRKNCNPDTFDDAAACDFLTAKFSALHPKGAFTVREVVGVEASAAKMRGALSMQDFAVKAGTLHCYYEKNNLWCGRVAFKGTRVVALADVTEMQEFMRGLGLQRMDPKTFFKDMREETIAKYLQGGNRKLWHVTVGPGDYLFVPANHLILESASAGDDLLGLRVAMGLRRDVKQYKVFADEAKLATTPCTAFSKAFADLCK